MKSNLKSFYFVQLEPQFWGITTKRKKVSRRIHSILHLRNLLKSSHFSFFLKKQQCDYDKICFKNLIDLRLRFCFFISLQNEKILWVGIWKSWFFCLLCLMKKGKSCYIEALSALVHLKRKKAVLEKKC